MPEKTKGRRATVRCQFCLTANRVDVTRIGDRPKCGQCGRPILLDRPIKITDDDFDLVVRGAEVPVLVDFYADWCGPCKMMAPVLDDLARERQGRLLVAKLDSDRSPNVVRRFGIHGIPTLILFRAGKESKRVTGAVPRSHLEQVLDGEE